MKPIWILSIEYFMRNRKKEKILLVSDVARKVITNKTKAPSMNILTIQKKKKIIKNHVLLIKCDVAAVIKFENILYVIINRKTEM